MANNRIDSIKINDTRYYLNDISDVYLLADTSKLVHKITFNTTGYYLLALTGGGGESKALITVAIAGNAGTEYIKHIGSLDAIEGATALVIEKDTTNNNVLNISCADGGSRKLYVRIITLFSTGGAWNKPNITIS